MLINGVDYGRAALGTESQWGKKQNRFIAGNGTVRVHDKSVEDYIVTFILPRVPLSLFPGLKVFLTQTAGYAGNPFTIVDDHGEAFTVRYWDQKVRFKERAGRFVKVTITVRIEN